MRFIDNEMQPRSLLALQQIGCLGSLAFPPTSPTLGTTVSEVPVKPTQKE